MLILDTATDGNKAESEKGKNVPDSTQDEIKSFHSSSVSKAAEMAAGYYCPLILLKFIFYYVKVIIY